MKANAASKRSGVLAGGNWIIDHVKTIDTYPALEQLANITQLEPSQLSMAIEWLLAKQLLAITSETVTPVASLTPLGETCFEQSAPIERILSAAREASSHGKRLTISDLHAKERLAFGRTIAQFEAVQWMLADAATQLAAARVLTWRAATT